MEASLKGEITFFSETKGDKIKFKTHKRSLVEIGSNPTCDIRIVGADDVHMKILLEEASGKVHAVNLSETHPITINGETIREKRTLRSGDVISLLNQQMRWDTKDGKKRRTEALAISGQKVVKSSVIKTNKRITIHNLQTMKNIEEKVAVAEKKQEESSTPETETAGSPPSSKENVSDNNTKVNALNLSGTLITSFTPQKAKSSRASSRTPSISSSPAPSSPMKAEREYIEASPCVRITKSMYLIDLVTPAPQNRGRSRSPSTSTPAASDKKRMPLSVKKTPTVRTASKNETLLKSAIKNSSIKKRLNDSTSTTTPTAKGRVLFAQSPILDVSNDSSSVVSVSFCSAEEGPSDQSLVKEEEITVEERMAELNEEPENSSENDEKSQATASDEETKQLLKKISIVIEEDKAAESEKDTNLNESQRTLDIETNFAKIAANATPANTIICQSVFNVNADNAEADFEKIVKPQTQPAEKVESLLNWIENTRETISSNVTEQVLSSRYSNITPNDSIISTVANTSTAYDAKTPKMSILDTVNGGGLTVSPVTRLSIGDNATTTVENYNLNSDIPKSLRSTRKRIGNAMASLHDMSQNAADSTIDLNESLNVSKNDQSMLEVTTNNILSLDAQPMEADEENERDENAENIPPSSNNFIAFAEHENETDDEREFFEISNSDVEAEEESSSSSEEEENNSDNEIETIEVLSSQEITPNPAELNSQNVAIKFRLSEQDLQEDGINPLDISSRTDEESENAAEIKQEEEEIEIPATQDMFRSDEVASGDDVEIPATQDILDESNVSASQNSTEDVEFPATQQILETTSEIVASEEISTDQMNDIIEGSGSVGLLDDTKTEEMESMIEEHLESSSASAVNAKESEGDEIIEEALDDSAADIEEILEKLPSEAEMRNSVTIEPIDDENIAENIIETSEAIIEEPDDDAGSNQGEYDEDELLKDEEEVVKPSENESIELFATEAFDDITDEIVQEKIAEDEIQEASQEKIPEVASPEVQKPEKEEKIDSEKNQKQQDPVSDTPSRPRRNSRVNYVELASMSPARTPRRGRSASVESVEVQQTPKVARSVRKVLDPIVEDSIAMKISVQVDKLPVDTFEIEVRASPPKEKADENPSNNVEIVSSDDEEKVSIVSDPIEEQLKEFETPMRDEPTSEISQEKQTPMATEEEELAENNDADIPMVETKDESMEKETAEPIEEPETAKPIKEPENNEPIEKRETPEPIEETETVEPTKEPETTEPINEPENDEPIKEPENPEPIKETESTEPIEEPETSEPITEPETPMEDPAEAIDNEYENGVPVEEEICVKKVAYVTTEDDDDIEEISEADKDEFVTEEKSNVFEVQDEATDSQPLVSPPHETIENIELKTDDDNIENSNDAPGEMMDVPSQKEDSQEEPISQKSPEKIIETPQEEIPSAIEELPEEVVPKTPSRRRGARVNYNELAGSSSITQSPKQTPKIARSGRKKAAETPSLSNLFDEPEDNSKVVEKEPEEAQKSEEVETESKTSKRRAAAKHDYHAMATGSPTKAQPTSRLRRGRSASVDVQPPSAKKIVAPKVVKPVKEKTVSPAKNSAPEEPKENSPKRAGSRRRALSESTEPEKIEQPAKKPARGRKAKNNEVIETPAIEEDPTPVEEPKKKTKGGRKAEEEPSSPVSEKKARKRTAKADEKEEEPLPVAAKKPRGRKVSEKEEEQPAEEPKEARGRRERKLPVEFEPTLVKRPRGAAKADKNSEKADKNSEKSENSQKSAEKEEDEVIAVEEPVKKGRGRKPKEAPQEIEPPKEEEKPTNKRGRKAAAPKETEEVVVETKKPARGRKPKVVEILEKEVQILSTVEEQDEQSEPEVKEPPKKTRGRGAKAAEKEVPVEPVAASTSKGRRGAKVTEEKTAEEPPKRGRRAATKEKETEVVELKTPPKQKAPKQVTIITPSTQQALEKRGKKQKSEEPPAPAVKEVPQKATTRKRAAAAQPVEVEEVAPTKRATRGKKK